MTEPDLAEQLAQAKLFIKLLLPVYQTWWYDVATFDPGDESPHILLELADDREMELACEAVEPYEPAIKAFIA